MLLISGIMMHSDSMNGLDIETFSLIGKPIEQITQVMITPGITRPQSTAESFNLADGIHAICGSGVLGPTLAATRHVHLPNLPVTKYVRLMSVGLQF